MIIRKSNKEDLPQVFELILQLAEFEKGLHEVTNTVEKLTQDFENKIFDCFVAEVDHKIVGISLYYFRYSTWKGKRFYLEDLMVSEAYKGRGIGKALLDISIEEAKNTNCSGMMWQVLDWNTPAIEFYKRYDTHFDSEWINVSINF